MSFKLHFIIDLIDSYLFLMIHICCLLIRYTIKD